MNVWWKTIPYGLAYGSSSQSASPARICVHFKCLVSMKLRMMMVMMYLNSHLSTIFFKEGARNCLAWRSSHKTLSLSLKCHRHSSDLGVRQHKNLHLLYNMVCLSWQLLVLFGSSAYTFKLMVPVFLYFCKSLQTSGLGVRVSVSHGCRKKGRSRALTPLDF